MKIQRIAIIGVPGSGKSTFANKLSQILNLPLYHLDKYQFLGKEKREKQEFIKLKKEILNTESWIIEGCSISTLELRFQRADHILYFQYPANLCLFRILKRALFHKRESKKTGCLTSINWKLLTYIWNFSKDEHHQIEKIRKQYPNVRFVVFKNDREASQYLSNSRNYS